MQVHKGERTDENGVAIRGSARRSDIAGRRWDCERVRENLGFFNFLTFRACVSSKKLFKHGVI